MRCASSAPCPTPSGARSPSNTIFVAQNTRAKRTELDEQAVQTFYLTNAWQQNDLNDVQTAMRNVLPERQGLRRAQPERHRDARHARRAAAGAKADQRPGQGARRGGGRHRRARSEQELGADPGHRLAQQRGHCSCSRPPPAARTTCPTGTTNCTPTTSTSPTLYNLAHLNAIGFRGHHRLGHGQPAADRLEYQDSAESAHPRHRRAEGDHEDRLSGFRSPPVLIRPARPPPLSARWSTPSSSTRTWA